MDKIFTRILAFAISLCLCVCCAACGKTSSNSDVNSHNSLSTPVVDDVSSNISNENSSNSSQNISNNSSNISSNNTTNNSSTNNSNNSLTNNSNNNSSNTSTNISSNVSYPTVNDSERPYYKPTSATLSFYDTANSSYGFTWNSEFSPIDPVIQICEGSTFNESKCKEYKATVKPESVNMPQLTTIYVCKVSVVLKQNTTYTYRAYDKGAKISSEKAIFKAANLNVNSFKFVHASDSQVSGESGDKAGVGTGEYFGKTLEGILMGWPDFMIHTGDFVQYSKYEGFWKNMLDVNAKSIMKLPIMAISGNHEASSYYGGSNETFKHFNIKMPTQASTTRGFYYSFDYGNTRFIMLNTNNIVESGLEAEQCVWLINQLQNNNKKWTIVSMHNPMYSVGKYGANPENNATALALRKQLSKIFAQYKVDLVLQGHDHAYSKTYPITDDGVAEKNQTYETINSIKYTVNPTGTIYSMHGPGGNQSRSPYSIDSNLYEIAAKSNTNSWAEISIDDNRLTVEIKYYKNDKIYTFDRYGIIKK